MKPGYFFPRRCLLCQQPLREDQWFCHHCQPHLPLVNHSCTICAAQLERNEICGSCQQHHPYFDRIVVAFTYHPPISALIRQFKYNHRFYAHRPLTQALIMQIRGNDQRLPQAIIPVPLHPRKTRIRGFNQSAIIARALSRAFTIPCLENVLVRDKYSKPQTSLSARHRARAVTNAFRHIEDITAKHIALVDDVVTTTSTLNQAAKAIKLSGAETVTVWALARNTLHRNT